MTHENRRTDLSRRTFLRGAGVATGAAVLGTGATGGSGSGDDGSVVDTVTDGL